MKGIAILASLLLGLGVASFGFAGEKANFAMNQNDVKTCGIPNCCPAQVKGKEQVSKGKAEASEQWSLGFREKLQINGIDLPTDR